MTTLPGWVPSAWQLPSQSAQACFPQSAHAALSPWGLAAIGQPLPAAAMAQPGAAPAAAMPQRGAEASAALPHIGAAPEVCAA